MLARVLEPEVMDTAAEARDYDAMDHRDVNRRFVDDLLAAAAGVETQNWKFLDLGTGTAQIPIELCRRAAKVRVVAVDAARHMLELARVNVERAGLQQRIALAEADAKRLAYPDEAFDCVVSNSIIHHLPKPMACVAEAVRVTKSSGLLFFRDLLRPADENELARLVDLYAPTAEVSAAADHGRAMFAASLHAALSLEEICELVRQLRFPAETVRATSDRHWTWSARKI